MKKLFLFILSFSYIAPLFAASSKSDGAKYAGSWWVNNIRNYGCAGTYDKMGLVALADNGTNRGVSSTLNDNYLDFRAEEYIARDINERGARFCKTIIGGDRSNCYGNPNTVYYKPIGEEDCFWLCKYGYYGNECSGASLSSPSKTATSISDYVGKRPFEGWSPLKHIENVGESIEESIPMFRSDEKISCGSIDRKNLNSANEQEHDIVLMLYNIRETIENEEMYMLVVPVVVRAGGTRGCWGQGSQRTAWPMLSAYGMTHTAVCPFDYVQRKGYIYAGDPNAGYSQQSGCPARGVAVTDADMYKVKQVTVTGRVDAMLEDCYLESRVFCIHPSSNRVKVVTEENEAQQELQDKKSNVCKGYTKEVIQLYNETLHDLVVVKDDTYESSVYDSNNWTGKCTLMKCKDSTKAFKPDWQTTGDVGCYECTGESGRYGVNNQGVCVQCVDKKEIFSTKKNMCTTAETFTKNEMLYGKNNQPSNKLESQCWIKGDPIEYKCCVSNNQIPGATACQSGGGKLTVKKSIDLSVITEKKVDTIGTTPERKFDKNLTTKKDLGAAIK